MQEGHVPERWKEAHVITLTKEEVNQIPKTIGQLASLL